jgi:hypothetical protein
VVSRRPGVLGRVSVEGRRGLGPATLPTLDSERLAFVTPVSMPVGFVSPDRHSEPLHAQPVCEVTAATRSRLAVWSDAYVLICVAGCAVWQSPAGPADQTDSVRLRWLRASGRAPVRVEDGHVVTAPRSAAVIAGWSTPYRLSRHRLCRVETATQLAVHFSHAGRRRSGAAACKRRPLWPTMRAVGQAVSRCYVATRRCRRRP